MLAPKLPTSVDINPTKFPFKLQDDITTGKAGKGEMQKINIVIEEIIISIIICISNSRLL